MAIQFPTHVVTFLQERGLAGSPDQWTFDAKAVSNDCVFLWFTNNEGVLVKKNDWLPMPMSKAAKEVNDPLLFGGKPLNLENVSNIHANVLLFPDGSMHWYVKDKEYYANMQDGSTLKTINMWCESLTKMENKWITKILGQKNLYAQMRQSLLHWKAHLVKTYPSKAKTSTPKKKVASQKPESTKTVKI